MHLNPKLYSKDIEKIPIRNGYGDGLVVAGTNNPNVVVLCADLTESTRSLAFAEKFPARFIEVGVAEQNMASLASGFYLAGKIPFISSYAMFSPGRNWEQIRTTICYNGANVKIAGAHAGVSVGPDGATHQAVEDIAITRVIPNMTVIAPCDSIEAKKATFKAAEITGPVYIRFAREKTPVITIEETPFEIGRAEIFKIGKDVSIIACGPLVYEAMIAAKDLEEKGISAEVINSHTIKPLDEEIILNSVKKTGAVVTVEEHQITGGLGGAIAEFLAQNYPSPIEMIGMPNSFGESGPPDELLEKFGMKARHIVAAAKKAIRRKNA